MLAPRVGVLLERAVIGDAYWILPCTDELLDHMRAGRAIMPLYTRRYSVTQVTDFN